MATQANEGKLLWEPSTQRKDESNLSHYMMWLSKNKNLEFSDYSTLWKWSVEELEEFWSSLWSYFDIQHSKSYSQVIDSYEMPGAKWFNGAGLSYTEHIFRNMQSEKEAVIFESEIYPESSITWEELYGKVAAAANGLKSMGVERGDRVVAYAPNIPETLIAFLACASIGAIWSSCSPDFGSRSVVDRFKQIEPKVLITCDGYRYGGKDFERLDEIKNIQREIPTIETTIIIPYLGRYSEEQDLKKATLWSEFIEKYKGTKLKFEHVPFNHPLWILYSSGTTGIPKAIVQSHGGVLLEHLKYGSFHTDLKSEDRFFWFTTTGWMMWNFLVSGLLSGATIILFDGNPGYPNANRLWEFVEKTKATIFGISPHFIKSCMKNGIEPKETNNLQHLKTIGSTGAPLPADAFRWVYEEVKEDIWLFSVSGGTDICSGFVGGNPLLPVREGEIQCRILGTAVQSFNEDGLSVVDEVGELVVTRPMPSMPLYFWNDADDVRYKESYFDTYPNVWKHGDFIEISSKGTCTISGRSDATINRGGIRMGTSEIYSVVERNSQVADSLVVDLPTENGESVMLLFVVLGSGEKLEKQLIQELKYQIQVHCSPRHVPNKVYAISEVPRTLSGKKMEVPIRKLLLGRPMEKVISIDSLANPKSLDYFLELAKGEYN